MSMETRTTDACFIFCPWKHFQQYFWQLTFVVLRQHSFGAGWAGIINARRVVISNDFIFLQLQPWVSCQSRLYDGNERYSKFRSVEMHWLHRHFGYKYVLNLLPSPAIPNHWHPLGTMFLYISHGTALLINTYLCLWKHERPMPASRFDLGNISGITFGPCFFGSGNHRFELASPILWVDSSSCDAVFFGVLRRICLVEMHWLQRRLLDRIVSVGAQPYRTEPLMPTWKHFFLFFTRYCFAYQHDLQLAKIRQSTFYMSDY